MSETFGDKPIDQLSSELFEVKRESFEEESSLREVDQKVIDIRKDLLIKYSQVFYKANKLVNVSNRNIEGSLSSKHFASRHLPLSVAIDRIIDSQLGSIPESQTMGLCKVNRQKSQFFQDEGKVDHEGKHSTFG